MLSEWMYYRLNKYVLATEGILPKKILMNKKLYDLYFNTIKQKYDFLPPLKFNDIPIELHDYIPEYFMVFLADNM